MTADAIFEADQETGQVRILDIRSIRPSPENDEIYHPVDPAAGDIQAMASSIEKYGVKEPLVITEDFYILSGHRRYAAAKQAGLTELPCRTEPIRRDDDPDAFRAVLVEFNRQRCKSFDEKMREELVRTNPEEAYTALIAARAPKPPANRMEIGEASHRAEISDGKQAFVRAVVKVVNDLEKYWGISVRTVHYRLLNDPPLRHTKKTGSTYRNDDKSYGDLCDLVLRMRLEGLIPADAIDDPTRPVTTYDVHADVQDFIREQVEGFLKGYWRDLMQSQPSHIEIVGEKNTLGPIIRPVAAKYCIPVTLGRGFCSYPPRRDMNDRFEKSGKSQLVVLAVSDLDPEGDAIAQALPQSMRDDFGIASVSAVKVAVTRRQALKMKLPVSGKAKKTSSRYKGYVKRYGGDDRVWEAEALEPAALEKLLADAIDSVIDVELFNQEIEQERMDAAKISGFRSIARELLTSIAEAA